MIVPDARVSSIVWRIDYVGIAVLIVASFYPVVYYSFYCVPGLRTFYLTVMSAFGVAVLVITLMDRFQAAKYTPMRAVLFSGLGACGAFPILHQTFFTWRVVPTPMIVTFWLELLMGACYLTGAYIYAIAVPEKWKPGRFDVWMSSHNIFHILVVMGAYVHYRAALAGLSDVHAHVTRHTSRVTRHISARLQSTPFHASHHHNSHSVLVHNLHSTPFQASGTQPLFDRPV